MNAVQLKKTDGKLSSIWVCSWCRECGDRLEAEMCCAHFLAFACESEEDISSAESLIGGFLIETLALEAIVDRLSEVDWKNPVWSVLNLDTGKVVEVRRS